MAASLGEMPTASVRRFDLLVDPLQRVGAPDLAPMGMRDGGEGVSPGLASRSMVLTRGKRLEPLGHRLELLCHAGRSAGENGSDHGRPSGRCPRVALVVASA
jgi:hypothetical protein